NSVPKKAGLNDEDLLAAPVFFDLDSRLHAIRASFLKWFKPFQSFKTFKRSKRFELFERLKRFELTVSLL
ncbi:MAG: hypothetical protein AABZ71_06990, partial [Candidatus Binatota bacterium]